MPGPFESDDLNQFMVFDVNRVVRMCMTFIDCQREYYIIQKYCLLWIMNYWKIWLLQPKITFILVSNLLYNNFIVLVWHSPAQNCIQSFYGTADLLTTELTILLMPSAKHNSTMDRSTGLIFSLFDVPLPWDVPCAYKIHISWSYLCPPLCSSSFCWQSKVCYI